MKMEYYVSLKKSMSFVVKSYFEATMNGRQLNNEIDVSILVF